METTFIVLLVLCMLVWTVKNFLVIAVMWKTLIQMIKTLDSNNTSNQ
jgi:hypothetical protein